MARTLTPTQAVIAGVEDAMKRAHLPGLDARLKSIVGSQIKRLFAGGWKQDEITRAAVDLALAWDERRGHNRLTHLQARMSALDYDRQQRAHVAQMAVARGNADELRELIGHQAKVAMMAGRPHPSTHDYAPSPFDGSVCDVCGGPWGVHVKARVNVE